MIGKDGLRRFFSGLISVAVLLVLWQVLAMTELIPSEYVPPPTAVVAALQEMVTDEGLIGHEIATVLRALGGLSAATAIAVAFSCLTARYRNGAKAFDPVAEFIRPLPPAAIIPMSIFFFGLGWPLYGFVVVFACFWPVYLNAARAMHATHRLQVQTANSFGYRGWDLVLSVQLMGALPDIFIGIRQAAALSLVATIVTEMLAGQSGIGFVITDASMTLRIPETFAGLLVVMLDGILLDSLALSLRRALVGWHAQYSAVRT